MAAAARECERDAASDAAAAPVMIAVLPLSCIFLGIKLRLSWPLESAGIRVQLRYFANSKAAG